MENIIHALIIEDKQDHKKNLRNRLHRIFPEIKLLEEDAPSKTVAEAVTLINDNREKLDLVFLDYALVDGDARDVLQGVSEEGEIDFEIIFVTGNRDLAGEWMEANGLICIDKPINNEKLAKAVEQSHKKRPEDRPDTRGLLEKLGYILQQEELKEGVFPAQRVVFREAGDIYFARACEILRAQGDGQYTLIYLSKMEAQRLGLEHNYLRPKLVLSEAANAFLSQVPTMIQVNRSEFVNLSFLVRVSYHYRNITLCFPADSNGSQTLYTTTVTDFENCRARLKLLLEEM
ncbi:MAG TPA: response regulator [Bacteroidetes bacterium]|nr:response regulator [Bacteroidota bacterium]